ncbi:serine/threonine-protein kinase [Paucibacter oligotrophus]|uniref:Serine/threonine-protein kinase n=1 Tax=Roseateles oligotrophus TaxID=1769250 RepID=A0A840L6Z9_9BURK|nr:serine/threonine-protein kinase [Roseateles oligotrophus]MBB4841939.1 serine/threonine-protein kinase [Roseateles oligotrophus]
MQAHDLVSLSQLLDQALDLPAAEREPWLARLDAGQQRWRETLRRLLAEHDHPQQTLDSLPSLAPLQEGKSDRPGERVGPYRLLRELGRGGMGVVWLAERADGAYQRQLALKLPRLSWEPSLDARLAHECEMAARLEHAHIARLYDAGRDAQGRPYLAMQYVDGLPIDRFCQEQGLGQAEILRLFLAVVRALAHAHGRLVVHGDLKPSNVLVTPQAQAFLLDFGIARLIGPLSLQTQIRQGLTPAYAAPEQLQGAPLSVACDVYSLGLLLYRLLTGSLPWDKPPAILAGGQASRGPAPLASQRARQLGRPARALQGELDALLAKALAEQPLQRYGSADALADDVQRYLDRMPLAAVGKSRLYRLRKRLQRHAWGFGLTALALAALSASAWLAHSQAQRAEAEARRTGVVKDFLLDIFRINARDNPAKTELRALPAQALLERGAGLIEQKFAAEPALRAELHGVVGDIFLDMASPQLAARHALLQRQTLVGMGAPMAEQAQAQLLLIQALIDAEQLQEGLNQARALLARAGTSPRQALQARLLAARSLLAQGQDAEAKKELALAQTQLQSLPQAAPTLQAELLRLQANRLNFLNNQFDQALPLYKQATALLQNQSEDLKGRAAAGFGIRADLVFSLINRHRWPEAKPLLEAALQSQRALGGANDLAAARLEANSLKWLYVTRQMPYAQAKQGIEDLRKLFQQERLGPPNLTLANLDYQLGSLLLEGGEMPRAYALLEASAKITQGQVEQAWGRYMIELNLGQAAAHTGQHALATRLLAQALRQGQRIVGADSPWLADGYVAAAENLRMQARFDEARQLLGALPPLQAVRGSEHNPQGPAQQIQLATAHLALARGEALQALQLLPAADPKADDLVMQDRQLLRGAALCQSQQARLGLPLMQAHLASIGSELSPLHPGLADWRAKAGLCALAAGQPAQAASLAAQAQAALSQQTGLAPSYYPALRQLLQALRSP